MIIRELNEKDLYQSAACMVECFGGGIDGDDLKMPTNKTLIGCFEGERLLAQLEFSQKNCFFNGKTVTCACIGGVSSFAFARRKGCVRALFEELKKPQYACDISILYPFISSYYRQFGYEAAGRYINLEIASGNLGLIERSGDVYVAQEEDLPTLLDIYNKNMLNINLAFERYDKVPFNIKPFVTPDFTYITNDKTGFCRLTMNRPEATLFVREINFGSAATLKNLLGFIRNFDSSMNTIIFEKLPLNSPILYMLKDVNMAKITTNFRGSVRVNNVKKLLEMKKYNGYGSFTIAVDDEKFAVEFSQGKVDVTEYSGETELEMTRAAASAILTSGIDRKIAEYTPGLVVNNPDSAFFGQFPVADVWFNDGF